MSDEKRGDVVTCVIKVNGVAIPDAYQIFSLRVEQRINRIATAVITFLDGDPLAESFVISSSSSFVPGNAVIIEAGYDGQNTVIFEGIVTKQSIRVANASGPLLEITCEDKAIKMTVGRKSTSWSGIKDSDVIAGLIANAGLSSAVASTAVSLPELVQFYVTDWDFMLARAELNSMVVSTVNNQVKVFDPITDTAPVLTLTFGDNLLAFNAELNAITQLAQVKASAWDYQHQQLISAEVNNDLTGAGNLSSKQLSAVVNLSSYALQTSAAQTTDELMAWAKSCMLRSALSKITGEATIQGTAIVTPGKYLTLAGMGDRFNGEHFVSSVRHNLEEGNWLTEVNIGLPVTSPALEKQAEAQSVAGLLPGIPGLLNATVKEIDADPESEYRILVDIAPFNDGATALWARLANFYASNGAGAFFFPEVGDEVILGFVNQDPRYPVILGSLYSQQNKPGAELEPDAKNSQKGIVSKSKLKLLFDDGNQILSLITPNNNTLVLDDKNKQIALQDAYGNSIVMSASGIAIKSDTNISLEAGQSVSIKGATGISVQSSGGDVSTSGLNIKENADVQYSASGNAEASVQSNGQLILKAGLVMIN